MQSSTRMDRTQSLPSGVRDRLSEQLRTPAIQVERLVREVFLVRAGQETLVVKRAVDADKEVIVSEVLSALKVPAFPVQVIDAGWVAMPYSPAKSVAAIVDREPGGLEREKLFYGLGQSLPAAFIAGMKDRNMDNVLFDVSRGRAMHLDYAAAFAEPLWRRTLAGHRLLGYLYRRLLLDPLVHLDEGDPVEAQRAFLEGVREESSRLAAIPFRTFRGVAFRRRVYCTLGLAHASRIPRVWPRAARLIQRKYLPGIRRAVQEPLRENLVSGGHALGRRT